MVQQRFWWPTPEEDVCSYVRACTPCNQYKTPRQPPMGLLQPLSVPIHPSFHISCTSSRACLALRGTRSFSPSSIGSVRCLTSLPSQSCHRPKRWRSCWCSKFSGFMGSRWTLCQTGGQQFTSSFWKEFCWFLLWGHQESSLGAGVLSQCSTRARSGPPLSVGRT